MSDNTDLLQAQWNRFNRVFPTPPNDDAQRLADEVRQSMDAWITSSLDSLQKEMEQNLTETTTDITAKITNMNNGIRTARDTLNATLDKLVAAVTSNGAILEPDKAALTKAIDDAKTAFSKAQDDLSDAGASTVSSISGIVKNIIGLTAT